MSELETGLADTCLWREVTAVKHKDTSNQFAKRLSECLASQCLTVRKAAQIAGVSTSTLQSWRSGTLPTDYAAVKKLAKHLGTTLSYLLTGEEDNDAGVRIPGISDVLMDGGSLFDGYAKITIQRLIPKKDRSDA